MAKRRKRGVENPDEHGPRSAGWAVAKDVLERFLREQGLRPSIGWVEFVAAGLSWAVYRAECGWHRGERIKLVARIPGGRDPERRARATSEMRLLRRLSERALPFEVPPILGLVELDDDVACVQPLAEGIAADLRAERFRGGEPWTFVARVAAAIHAVPIEGLELNGPATRREACAYVFEDLDALGGPEGEDAKAWAREHLPPEDARSTLVHGDLLGQNLLLDPWETDRVTVIDWEYARLGDPAYDLAIVTRGARNPFQVSGGLEKLLDAYREAAPDARDIDESAVRLHELSLRAANVIGARREGPMSAALAENELLAFRSLLERAMKR